MKRGAQVAACVAAVLVLLQLFFALLGIDGFWQWGHHGFNPAAYQIAAWNTLEWGNLFPAQYHTAPVAPAPDALYTNAPLLLHLCTTASVGIFGDARWAVRLVPALHGVLAAMALFWIVRRHYGDARAVLALGVYVLLPINHGFANMTNHSTGFILWGLVALHAHLRGRHWLRLVAIVLCCNWDWPGYYIAFAIAVHWLGSAWRRRAWDEWKHAALYCAVVLLSFAGFFVLAYGAVGSFDAMFESWSLRTQGAAEFTEDDLWGRTILPMFGVATLLAGLGWVLLRGWRPRERDLIPLAFLFAGVLHTALFQPTAIVHIYWPWPLNPFMAVAAADLLWSAGLLVRGRAQWGVRAAAIAAFSALFLSHTVPLGVELRRKGGSLHHEPYHAYYQAFLFAEQVHRWTAPGDKVQLLYGTNTRPEILATIHRHTEIERERRQGRWIEAGTHLVGDLRFYEDNFIRAAERRGTVRVLYPYFHAAPGGKPGRVTYRMVLENTGPVTRLLSSPFDPRVRVIKAKEESVAGSSDSLP